MIPKKILLITYYWVPSGGVGVLRWLHFANQLAEMDFDITVLHPKKAHYPQFDFQLIHQTHQKIKTHSVPIFEPQMILNKLRPNKATSGNSAFQNSGSFIQDFILNIRANYFIPDARMFWIKPASNFLKKHLKENQYDFIISNGPPHTCHMIGYNAKQLQPSATWIADFRDPWQEIDYFDQLPLTINKRRKHQELEAKVIQNADAVTTVSPSWKSLFKEKGAKRVEYFTNGFSIQQFKTKTPSNQNNSFTIRHIGSIDESRNPSLLWKVLHHFPKIQLELIGNISSNIQKEVAEMNNISIFGQVSHQRAIELMKTSDTLLLCNNKVGANKGRIPAKLFEYIGAKQPILYFGRLDNDAAEIIQNYQLGICLPYSALEKDISVTLSKIQDFQLNENNNMIQFSRKEIAKQYAQFLNEF